ncbi:MAG: hypothetical protein ACLQSR_14010 [Limisphaerales bacterium]
MGRRVCYTGGTIFSVNTNESDFTNLYDFDINDTLSDPNGLALSGNTFYGTTYSGGGLNAANFNLQTSPDLLNWSNITTGITTFGSNYTFTNTMNGQAAFFRLQTQ